MYKLKESIQYKKKYYRRNDTIKIDDKDLDEFIRRDLIYDLPKSNVRGLNTNKDVLPSEDVKEPVKRDTTDYNAFTVAELKVMLDNEEIPYKSTAVKSELIDLLRGV